MTGHTLSASIYWSRQKRKRPNEVPQFYEGENGEIISKYGQRLVKTGRTLQEARSKRTTRMMELGRYSDPLDPPNSRLEKLIDGELPVEKLDDEELSAGIPKCDDGKFSKHAAFYAAALPSKIQKAIQQELYKRADRKLNGSLLGAIDTILDIATGDGHEDKDRLKASQYILERVRGKTPDVVVHSQDKPWEMVLDGVETVSRAESRARRGLLGNAVDAEVVDDIDGEVVDDIGGEVVAGDDAPAQARWQDLVGGDG